MILSFIDGRVRIRNESLKNTWIAEMVREGLTSLGGVIEVITNQRVGSILIVYDAALTDIKQITLTLSGFIDTEIVNKKPLFKTKSLSVRKAANIGMLASLLMSLMGAALGFTKIHVAAGLLFLGFWSIHLFRYREMIFA